MTMKPVRIVLAAAALLFLGHQARAIDLNPFSIIKGAVEAAAHDLARAMKKADRIKVKRIARAA